MSESTFDDDTSPLTPDELNDPDLQIALEAMLAGMQPVLDADGQRALNAEALIKETLAASLSCEEEFAFAQRLFEPMGSAEVSLALLPAAAREMLGPVDSWRACLLHIRCCYIFGWLLCRRPRHYKPFIEALTRYWRCVREAIGQPVANPPTAEQRADLQTLLELAARVFEAPREAAGGLPSADLADQALQGKLGCDDAPDSNVQMFARMLSTEASMALLGKDAFERQRQSPYFWFCRCWCLCAIRYGCCLAHARTYIDRLRCLAWYRRCLRRCLQPLTCHLDQPQGCVAEQVDATLGAMVVPVMGTAAGGAFSHYTLEWSSDGVVWHANTFYYPPIPPGNAAQGNAPVNAGLLAYLDTGLLDPGTVFLRLTVVAATGATCVASLNFSLFKQDVRILGINGYANMNTSWLDPAAQLVETVGALCTRATGTSEVSFGECLTVQGAAFVGGCEDKTIRSYTLDYKPGYEADCGSAGWTSLNSPGLPMPVNYDTAVKRRYINRRNDFSNLTAVWGSDCMVAPPGPPVCFIPPWRSVPEALLYPSCWQTHVADCQMSGLYTLRLTVTASDGSTYCDTQRLWIDNKQPCALIRIDAVAPCADLYISQFAAPPDCSTPWPLPVKGIAYDEPIDTAQPLNRPNDNFDYYYVTMTRQGGPSIQIPVPGPGGTCFYGTSAVGDPDTTVASCKPWNPDHPGPNALIGTLAQFDMRAVDAVCKSAVTAFVVPDGFALARGECCIYTFDLHVYDRTLTSAGPHRAQASWAVKICNDLPQLGP